MNSTIEINILISHNFQANFEKRSQKFITYHTGMETRIRGVVLKEFDVEVHKKQTEILLIEHVLIPPFVSLLHFI